MALFFGSAERRIERRVGSGLLPFLAIVTAVVGGTIAVHAVDDAQPNLPGSENKATVSMSTVDSHTPATESSNNNELGGVTQQTSSITAQIKTNDSDTVSVQIDGNDIAIPASGTVTETLHGDGTTTNVRITIDNDATSTERSGTASIKIKSDSRTSTRNSTSTSTTIKNGELQP